MTRNVVVSSTKFIIKIYINELGLNIRTNKKPNRPCYS